MCMVFSAGCIILFIAFCQGINPSVLSDPNGVRETLATRDWNCDESLVLDIGNSPSDSRTVLSPVQQDVGFLLLDHVLVNGTLREIAFTTANRISPLRLQIWRPYEEASASYLLLFEMQHFSASPNNHTLYPGDDVIVQYGDQIGFLCETTQSGIVYDFLPQSQGARLLTKAFNNLPKHEEVYSFDRLEYDTWVFAISVKVDTEYGRGPLDVPSSTEAATTAPPYGVYRIGNNVTSGLGEMTNQSSIIVVFDDYSLPDGYVISLCINMGVANQTTWLQIWRPLGNYTYLLMGASNFTTFFTGNQTITLETPVRAWAGDVFGFYSPDGIFPVVHSLPNGNGSIPSTSILQWNSTNGSLPLEGESYIFTSNSTQYYYAAAVDIDTDLSNYREWTPFASTAGMTTEEIWSLAALVLIYVLVVLVSSCCAIWLILSRSGKVDLVKTVYPVVSTSPDLGWIVPRDHIFLKEILSFTTRCTILKAEVFSITYKQRWSTAAIKMLIATASDQEKHVFLREMEVMKMQKPHPNVLQLLGFCTEKDPMMMVVESVPFGNLLDYLREVKDTHIKLNIAGHSNYTLTMDLIGFATQIARGMTYLSSLRILHRDLSTRNVLLGEGRLCKITHFGHAQDVVEIRQYERMMKCPIPVRWMAPESIQGNMYTVKTDVWAFGILMWEIITLGATPYHQLDHLRVTKTIRKGVRLEQPPHCRQELYDVISSCWKTRPQDRPGFEAITRTLQGLHDQNRDLIQLEKYPEHEYGFLKSTFDSEEII